MGDHHARYPRGTNTPHGRDRERIRRRPPPRSSPLDREPPLDLEVEGENTTVIRAGIRADLHAEIERERAKRAGARVQEAVPNPDGIGRQARDGRRNGRESRIARELRAVRERERELRARTGSRAEMEMGEHAELLDPGLSASTQPASTLSPAAASTSTATPAPPPAPAAAPTLAPEPPQPQRPRLITTRTTAPAPTQHTHTHTCTHATTATTASPAPAPSPAKAVYTPSAFTPRPPKRYLPRASGEAHLGTPGLVSALRARLAATSSGHAGPSSLPPAASTRTGAPSAPIPIPTTIPDSASTPVYPSTTATSHPASTPAVQPLRTASIHIRTPHVPPAAPTSTIKLLQLAFEDTPPQLRELESGWRDVRARLGAEVALLAKRERLREEREKEREREKEKGRERESGKAKEKERRGPERDRLDKGSEKEKEQGGWRVEDARTREVPQSKRKGKDSELRRTSNNHERERESPLDAPRKETRRDDASSAPTSAPGPSHDRYDSRDPPSTSGPSRHRYEHVPDVPDITKTLRWKEPLSTVSASYTVLTATAGLPTPPSSPRPDCPEPEHAGEDETQPTARAKQEHEYDNTIQPTPCPDQRARRERVVDTVPVQPVQTVQSVHVAQPTVPRPASRLASHSSRESSQPSQPSQPSKKSPPSELLKPPASELLKPPNPVLSKPSRPPSRPLPRPRVPSSSKQDPSPNNTPPPAPRPILAHPLPPTDPTELKSGYTVAVHPPSSEFGLTFVLGRTVARVSAAGDTVVVTGKNERTLRLADLDDEGRQVWETLAGVVAGLKRVTPRVKIYGTLGDMVLTCTDPPDVVLTFVVPTPLAAGAPTAATKSKPKATFRPGETRVRIRYSLLMAEYILETACRRDGETFKSRRAGRLVPPRDAGGPYATLGIVPDETRWSAAEHEAVRRLWGMRDEWRAYVLGRAA